MSLWSCKYLWYCFDIVDAYRPVFFFSTLDPRQKPRAMLENAGGVGDRWRKLHKWISTCYEVGKLTFDLPKEVPGLEKQIPFI